MRIPLSAGHREWVGFAVLALPCLVYAMDLTVLNLAVPAISAELRPTTAQALWMIDIYGFAVAGSLVTMGAVGDRIGARRLLLTGAAAFAVVSVLAAVATSPVVLIVSRALLGLAGATIAPTTLSLIRSLFTDDARRARAIGLWVASYSLGAAIGPVVGGAVLEAFGWRAVFAMPLPVMALLLGFGPRLLPERRTERPTGVDLPSAAASLLAVLAVVHGLKELALGGDPVPAVAALVAGAALGTAFVRRQLRMADPLVDLRLFRRPIFAVALVTNLVAFFALGGMALFVVQYLQSVLGLSALGAGLWMVPEAVGFVFASFAAPRLAARLSERTVLAAALLVGALGYAAVALGGGLLAVVAGTTLGGVGLAAVITVVTDIAVGAVPAERAGAAAATSETSSELGGALGLALLGSLGAAVYRAGLPPASPATALDTVGAAVAVSHDLPPADGAGLVAAAGAAFTDALMVTAAVSSVILGAAAALVVLVLRPAVPTAPPEAAVPQELRCA